MTYKYTEFDGVPLPEYNPSQKHDPTGMSSALLRSIGGTYDSRGTTLGRPTPQTLAVTGVYVGAVEYLVDESGDMLVDENGDYLIAGDAQEMARAQVVAIREKARARGPLWRVWLDDESVREWKTARLLAIRQTVTRDKPLATAELALEFETAMDYWHAESATVASVSTTSGVATLLWVDNAGEIVEDAVLTVIHNSGTITAVSIVCLEAGIDLAWTGTLVAGNVLTIDAGNLAVPEDAVDSYNGLVLGTGHTATGWLTLPQGASLFVVTVTGGTSTITMTHYTQYP